MAENTSAPVTASLPGAQPPPSMNAGHLIVAAGLTEFSIVFGQTRMMPTAPQGGTASAQPMVEWFATITMSPMIAEQLLNHLETALEQYETTFGPLPEAPATGANPAKK